jgi:hypothetical protein
VSGVDFDREDWRRDLEEPWEGGLSLTSEFVLADFFRSRKPEDDGAEMLLMSLGDETATTKKLNT